ncbi:MAG: bifunctional 5,10-methylenetetrahydrofolate dehydrogenase/5,10-methenyltetrahydrofolate cyclohydrolase [Abditibacteriota bacterium]|nr:bifunctional 5,10-methylenetetrahydrofolate dehydrogenase/5,10-methenyltetrahydrofolate cyclohydrolase [Abditibacteriota bacterium]
MAQLLDGKALSQTIRGEIRQEVERLAAKGVTPRLSVILVGSDPASVTYTRMKKKACEKLGMISDLIVFPEDARQEEIEQKIDSLNADPSVHGIMVQHPVPRHLDELAILSRVSVAKDVDGISSHSLGNLCLGTADFVSCTPLGIVTMLERYDIPIEGKKAVVIGRSIILGKPVALALLERNATVTICHSRTRELPEIIGQADIVVAAIGKPEFIKGEWIKDGAVVVDAGYNKVEGRDHDVGDVEYEEAAKRASWITPVPGGVGPMTITMLLWQTLKSAKKAAGER